MICIEKHILVKNLYKGAKLFNEIRNSIQVEDRPGRPSLASTPKMVDSVNELILGEGRVIIEEISEQMGISMGTAHKTVHDDLTFSNFSCRWVSQGRCKAQYCSKNSGNYLWVYLRKVVTSSLQSRSGAL